MLLGIGTRTNVVIGVLVVAVALSTLGVAGAQTQAQTDVERVIRDFLVAFSNRDVAVFVPYFSDDATVLFPPHAYLVQARGAAESEAIRKGYQEMLTRLCNIKKVWCLPESKGK